jgi:hypothetical protein
VLDFEFALHWMLFFEFAVPRIVCWIFNLCIRDVVCRFLSLLYTGCCFLSLLYPECCLLDFEFALYRMVLLVCCTSDVVLDFEFA